MNKVEVENMINYHAAGIRRQAFAEVLEMIGENDDAEATPDPKFRVGVNVIKNSLREKIQARIAELEEDI